MRYRFSLRSEEARHRHLPDKVFMGRQEDETETPLLLRLLGFLLFFRSGLQVQTNLHQENIPFLPDLAQVDYALVPRFWGECRDCSLKKLEKLAAKLPKASIWVLRPSFDAVHRLHREMGKAGLKTGRYGLMGFDPHMIEEMGRLLSSNNEMHWVAEVTESRHIQFDFNDLWFDAPYEVLHF